MFPVDKICKVLQISKSGSYNWLKLGLSKRWLENQKMLVDIHQIFEDSNSSYGHQILPIQKQQKGGCILRVIIDLFNRKVVGWSMSDNLTTEETNYKRHITVKLV